MNFSFPALPPETYPDWKEISSLFARLNWDEHRPKVIRRVQEVAPKIYSIEVPQGFYAETKAYLILGEEPTLVDPGHAYPETLESLLAGMQTLGLVPGDLARVVLTHPHVDHAAACVPLFRDFGIRVSGFPGVGEKYADYSNLVKVAYDHFRPRVPHIHAAGFTPEEILAFPVLYYFPPGPIGFREALREGDRVKMGDRFWEVFYTPGHSLEHIMLVDQDGLALSGDLIVGRATSLGEIGLYLKTLEKLAGLPLLTMLPAHGGTISNPRKRIEMARKTVEGYRAQALELLEGAGLTLLELTRAIMGDISKIHLASTSTGLILSLLDELAADGLVRSEPGPADDPAGVIYRKIA